MCTDKLLLRATAYRLQVLLLSTFALSQTVRSETACEICDCFTQGTYYVVNCDNRKLGEIPDHLPSQTTNLSLSNNHIKFLDRINLSSLLDFKADNNKIEYMLSTAFQSCKKLRQISLADNRLSSDNFPHTTFSNNKALTHINFSHNTFTSIPDISEASSLIELLLIDNDIQQLNFPSTFSNLVHLQTLNLKQNSIQKFAAEAFRYLSNSPLETLILSTNSINSIEERALQPLKNLKNLDIGNNHLSVESIVPLICHRDIPQLSKLNIDRLNISSSGPDKYFTQLLSCLAKLPTLRELSIRYSDIRSFEVRDWKYQFEQLQVLNLEGNAINFVDRWVVRNMTNLVELNLSRNRLEFIPESSSKKMKRMFLNNNKLSRMYSYIFSELTALETLDLSDNSFYDLPSGTFLNLTSLRVLNLSQNHIPHLPDDIFKHQEQLRILSLRSNRLRTLCGAHHLFDPLTKLTELHMGDNNLSCIKQDIFRTMSSLKILQLEKNQFRDIFRHFDVNSPTIFKDLSSLESINLDLNKLEYLPIYLFSSLKNIKNISVEQNYLTGISSAAFPRNHQLNLYSLVKNSIPTVLEKDMKQLNVRIIDFTDNPFDCNCDLAWFCSWLKNEATGARNKLHYKCKHSTELLVNFDPAKHGCKPGKVPYKLTFTILWIGLLVAGVVIIILLIMFLPERFRYYQFASLIKKDLTSYKEYERVPDYSAYFCYTQEAESWIERYLSPLNTPSVFSRLSVEKCSEDERKAKASAIAQCRVAVILVTPDLALNTRARIELAGITLRYAMDKDRDSEENRLKILVLRLSDAANVPKITAPVEMLCMFKSAQIFDEAEILTWDQYSREDQRRCFDRLREAGVELLENPQ